nr:hypothetical protein [Tanacetum cinerariifolium]
QGEALSTVSGLEAGHDRENIIKTSALPHDSTPRVTSLDADEGSTQKQLQELMEFCISLQRIKLLEDKDRGNAELIGDDALIKGKSMEIGEEVGGERSTERGMNDTKEMVNVLTSMEAANILVELLLSVFSLLLEFQLLVFPLSVDLFPLNNEVITRHLQEYEQSETELTIGEKIDLINELESNIGESDNIRDGGKIAGREITTWGGGMGKCFSMRLRNSSECSWRKSILNIGIRWDDSRMRGRRHNWKTTVVILVRDRCPRGKVMLVKGRYVVVLYVVEDVKNASDCKYSNCWTGGGCDNAISCPHGFIIEISHMVVNLKKIEKVAKMRDMKDSLRFKDLLGSSSGSTSSELQARLSAAHKGDCAAYFDSNF